MFLFKNGLSSGRAFVIHSALGKHRVRVASTVVDVPSGLILQSKIVFICMITLGVWVGFFGWYFLFPRTLMWHTHLFPKHFKIGRFSCLILECPAFFT